MNWNRMPQEHVERFMVILKAMNRFQDRAEPGRLNRWLEVRKACAAHPEDTRVFVAQLDVYLYGVVLEMDATADGIYCATAYEHEDGLALERLGAPEGHPVHSIECMGDLFALATGDISEAREPARELMEFGF